MKKTVIILSVFLLLSAIFIAPVQSETETVDQLQAETETVDQPKAETETIDQPQAETEIVDQLPESVETSGRVDGSGTYFEITNSAYLDVSLESTAEIKLTLESVPQVVTIRVKSAAGAASTQITLGGLLPSTTYYKYEDDFHNIEVFTTDSAGTHVFIQDLTNSHIIFIQPRPSTYFISDDAGGGDCAGKSIGSWDPETKTCTLTRDLDQTIQIDSDDITLDGAGHRLVASTGSNGIFLSKRKNVTIKNLTIEQFSYGICLFQSKNNKLSDNTLSGNDRGIYLADNSDDNMLVDNYALNQKNFGIYLQDSENNKLSGNTLSGHEYGIYLAANSDNNVISENSVTNSTLYGISLKSTKNNVIADNSVSLSTRGINLIASTDNSLTNNTADANTSYGIYLTSSSDNNTLSGNTLSNNGDSGLILFLCENNIIYNNNFIDNTFQVRISGGADNIFNMNAPAGGNYWSDYDECTDENDDGFCDAPYGLNGVLDELPWTIQNGWLDSDGDGIPDDEDDCPDAAGPVDQNGCPYADETHVSMRIVDFQRSGVCGHDKRGRTKWSCEVDLEAVMVRIYDREDEQFLETYGSWPSRRRLDDIFQEEIGLTGLCTTDGNGKCLVGDDNQGKFLVVAKYVDMSSHKTVYIGKFKDFRHHGYDCWWGWYPDDAGDDSFTPPTKLIKNLHINKLIQRNGKAYFLGKYMMVTEGP
jgi:parallel beta-helix repeat protein